MLFTNAIQPATLDLLKRLQGQAELSQTRLVGGTALALQLGHRLSVDIDLFGIWDKTLDVGEILCRCGGATEEHRTANIRVFILSGIKVDLVYYEHPWLTDAVEEEGIRLATVSDIAPMKLEAINNRGSKKDFVDLAFILDVLSLGDLLALYRKKYPRGSEYLVLRSLVYFEDAEDDPMPVMLRPMTWEEVKGRIREEVRRISLA
jgi:hypothetical protein